MRGKNSWKSVDMDSIVIRFTKNLLYEFVLVILLVANICFYTMETMTLFLALTSFAIALGAYTVVKNIDYRRVHLHPCVVWLILIYGIFTFNGLLRLRHGTYNWDMMLYTCVENIIIYFLFVRILSSEQWEQSIVRITVLTSILSLMILFANESAAFRSGGIRIGDSLSGNVNVFGASLGVMSVFLAYVCMKKKSILYWALFSIVAAVMLLTGSKMTVLVLMVNLLFFMENSEHKVRTFFFVLIAGLGLLFLVFSVPRFYQIIGFRIEDMIAQMFHMGKGGFSNSTLQREIMLKEGFGFFWNHPLFGGGEKYFGSLTSTVYDYSHCNYVELLCNFGLFGFCIYYIPVFSIFFRVKRNSSSDIKLSNLVRMLLLVRLILDWVLMTHSEPCVGYVPMLFSFAYAYTMKKNTRSISIPKNGTPGER